MADDRRVIDAEHGIQAMTEVVCPHCGEDHWYYLVSGRVNRYACKVCRRDMIITLAYTVTATTPENAHALPCAYSRVGRSGLFARVFARVRSFSGGAQSHRSHTSYPSHRSHAPNARRRVGGMGRMGHMGPMGRIGPAARTPRPAGNRRALCRCAIFALIIVMSLGERLSFAACVLARRQERLVRGYLSCVLLGAERVIASSSACCVGVRIGSILPHFGKLVHAQTDPPPDISPFIIACPQLGHFLVSPGSVGVGAELFGGVLSIVVSSSANATDRARRTRRREHWFVGRLHRFNNGMSPRSSSTFKLYRP